MNKKITSLNDNKIPSYVSIYNQIYSDIVDGVYKNGSQLPSEPVLAEKYGVSRNTLRQALTILNEDHLIAKQQGKGAEIRIFFHVFSYFFQNGIYPVSYTHLDVYKRQLLIMEYRRISIPNTIYVMTGMVISNC